MRHILCALNVAMRYYLLIKEQFWFKNVQGVLGRAPVGSHHYETIFLRKQGLVPEIKLLYTGFEKKIQKRFSQSLEAILSQINTLMMLALLLQTPEFGASPVKACKVWEYCLEEIIDLQIKLLSFLINIGLCASILSSFGYLKAMKIYFSDAVIVYEKSSFDESHFQIISTHARHDCTFWIQSMLRNYNISVC